MPRCGRPFAVSSILTATTDPAGTGASPVSGLTGAGVGVGVGVGVGESGSGVGAAIDRTGGDGVGGLHDFGARDETERSSQRHERQRTELGRGRCAGLS